LGEGRRAFLAGASGRVLEVGAGTGANFSHYPAGLELVAVEPDAAMLARARRRAAELHLAVDLRAAAAYPLPFPAESFDTVVFGLCLCTIPEPGRALAEARRVLRPGGKVLFLEHVRAQDPGLARWQDRLAPAWGAFAGGCRPNRDTRAEFEKAGFEFDWIVEKVEDRSPVAIVRPGIMGAARVAR
jgi:ubiquinone/menaquinone biosynthesis C-methylase UbiE